MKTLMLFLLMAAAVINAQTGSLTYPVVDTDQSKFFNNTSQISEPDNYSSFYYEDAHYNGNQSSYTDNGDGTITDNVTGLMWQKDLLDSKYTFEEAFEVADTFSLAGYNDWRVPTIKELYSLILFTGVTGTSKAASIPYLNTDYFDFRYGDDYDATSRYIDAQFATSTAYVSTVMNGQPAMFGVNFADGRIKGYPQDKEFEVKLVRGNPDYGINNFTDNNDGTITDLATGLMWDKSGSSEGMNWEKALEYVRELNSQNYLGYNDWRLPNAKELQSIVDYTRSPSTTNSAAIDPVFEVPVIKDEGDNDNYPFYWTNTTHEDGPDPFQAVYVAFGEALGYMQFPGDNSLTLYDVHGAGAQRSDPKTGDPSSYPYGRGPQGDVIRINNYVRVVRDAEITTGLKSDEDNSPDEFKLEQNYPNPFNPVTSIQYAVGDRQFVSLKVFNILGNEITTLVNETKEPGNYSVTFDASGQASGVYLFSMRAGDFAETKRMVLMK